MASTPGRWLLAYPILFGTALAVYLCLLNTPWSIACYRSDVCDAQTFVVVGELLAEGGNPYSTEARIEHIAATRMNGQRPATENPFQYPPHSLPFFAMLRWRPAVLVPLFVGVSTASVLMLLAAHVLEQGKSVAATFALLIGFAAGSINALNAALGQTGAVAGLLAIGVVMNIERRRWLAGALLGLLTFKPQYAIPLVVIGAARRQWPVLLGALATGLAMTALSAAVYGIDRWIQFFQVLGETNRSAAYMVNWLGPLDYWTSLRAPAAVSLGVYAVFLIGLFVLARWRPHLTTPHLLAVGLGWTLLFNPNTHPYDLFLLAPSLSATVVDAWPWMVGAPLAIGSWLAITTPLRWLFTIGLLINAVVTIGMIRKPQNL